MRYEIEFMDEKQFWIVDSDEELRVGDIIETGQQELRVAGRRALATKKIVGFNEYRVEAFRLRCVKVD